MATITIKEAQRRLRERGMTLRHDYGEYRVNYRNGREASAYYSNDLIDAMATAMKMASHPEWNEPNA